MSSGYYNNGIVIASPPHQTLRPCPSRPGSCHFQLPRNHLAECPVLGPTSSGPSQASPLWYTELANRKHSEQLSVCLLRKKNPEISNDWNFSHNILLSCTQINKETSLDQGLFRKSNFSLTDFSLDDTMFSRQNTKV